eukprot:comp4901_c0_seq1/m.1002 comp4901_c0_seq1/g.1002  ORF comp4901_c0_seq1/g.1002 comp4901_c0_seq1/m.1002 type:complete len:588 (-) comp4901_c0_seq1:592-2355(-)
MASHASTAVLAAKKKRRKAKAPMAKKSKHPAGGSGDAYRSDSDFGDSDEEEEDPSDYRRGGYHPVCVGEVYNNRYKVLHKLGWGYFSTVWLVWDTQESRYGALKVVKSASNYTEAAIDEIKLLKRVRDADPNDGGREFVVTLYDDFVLHGPNGKHICMVFEVLGHNLLKLIREYNYDGLPLYMVKDIARQVLAGTDYLHTKCQIIHTDIKPENILLTADPDFVRRVSEHALRRLSNPVKPQKPTGAPLTKNQKKKQRQKAKKQQPKAGTNTADGDESDESETKSVQSQGQAVNGANGTQDGAHSESKPTEVEGGEKTEQGASEGQTPQTPRTPESPREGEDEKGPKDDSLRDVGRTRPLCVKLADLGNACWADHHFTDDIQTRQYRSPEVIVEGGYDSSADIWSIACMLFELGTGDYLFHPKASRDYSRDEDHLALIIELLGPLPKHVALGGARSKEFFNKEGRLRRIHNLKGWALTDVLHEKYRFKRHVAEQFADFLVPMLNVNPRKRATAKECLEHPWLRVEVANAELNQPDSIESIHEHSEVKRVASIVPITQALRDSDSGTVDTQPQTTAPDSEADSAVGATP